jgi:hypothetical protein
MKGEFRFQAPGGVVVSATGDTIHFEVTRPGNPEANDAEFDMSVEQFRNLAAAVLPAVEPADPEPQGEKPATEPPKTDPAA